MSNMDRLLAQFKRAERVVKRAELDVALAKKTLDETIKNKESVEKGLRDLAGMIIILTGAGTIVSCFASSGLLLPASILLTGSLAGTYVAKVNPLIDRANNAAVRARKTVVRAKSSLLRAEAKEKAAQREWSEAEKNLAIAQRLIKKSPVLEGTDLIQQMAAGIDEMEDIANRSEAIDIANQNKDQGQILKIVTAIAAGAIGYKIVYGNTKKG